MTDVDSTKKKVSKRSEIFREEKAEAIKAYPFFGDAKRREFQELGIAEYEIRCTLDERTCKICAQYNGKRYLLGKGPMPTFHPNCRCGIRQVIPDDVRARMTRAARDENGKSIKVPASMTYEEWNARYGKTPRQTDLPPAPEFKRAETREASSGQTRVAPKKGIEKVGNISTKVPEDNLPMIKYQFNTAPDVVKDAMTSLGPELKIFNTNASSGLYVYGQGIHYDAAVDAIGHEYQDTGEYYSGPNVTLFHELGHNMSYMAVKRAGHPRKDFANVFQSSKYKKDSDNGNESGYTLSDMIQEEGDAYIEGILKRLIEEHKEGALPTIDTAHLALKEELKGLPIYACGDVSDIFCGVTKAKVWARTGHEVKYWDKHRAGEEAFAEMLSATVTNPLSLETIKLYFPKSYDIFLEMLKAMK